MVKCWQIPLSRGSGHDPVLRCAIKRWIRRNSAWNLVSGRRPFGIQRSRNRTRSARLLANPSTLLLQSFPKATGTLGPDPVKPSSASCFPPPPASHSTAAPGPPCLRSGPGQYGYSELSEVRVLGTWGGSPALQPTLMLEGMRLGDETAALVRLKRQRGCHSLSCLWRGSKNVGSEVHVREELGRGHQLELGSR